MQKIYLDNAATTPVREEVIGPMQDALVNCFGNPSSTHGFGRSAKTAIEQARKTIAKIFERASFRNYFYLRRNGGR